MNVGEIHQLQALDSVASMELLLGLMESADHEYVNFVVLADVILTLLDSFDKLLLEFFVAFSGGQCGLREGELHECLIQEDSGKEVEFFFTDDGGFVMFV